MYFLKYADGAISFTEALNVSITGIVVVMLILALLAVLVLLLSKAIRAVESAAKKKSTQRGSGRSCSDDNRRCFTRHSVGRQA